MAQSDGCDSWKSRSQDHTRGSKRKLTMNILKLALLGSLRIVFFGFLKVALCAYTLFLPDTAFAGAVREGKWPS
jgi:hypothetical protein